MFCLSENGNIRITRGDTIQFPFVPATGNSVSYLIYPMQERDEMYFGVMEPNSSFEDALIRKKYTYAHQNSNGSIIVDIDSSDTEYLLPGMYYYQIKMNIYDAVNDRYIVQTVMPKNQFWIEE